MFVRFSTGIPALCRARNGGGTVLYISIRLMTERHPETNTFLGGTPQCIEDRARVSMVLYGNQLPVPVPNTQRLP